MKSLVYLGIEVTAQSHAHTRFDKKDLVPVMLCTCSISPDVILTTSSRTGAALCERAEEETESTALRGIHGAWYEVRHSARKLLL